MPCRWKRAQLVARCEFSGFMRTHIDHLVLWPFVLDKARQPEWKEGSEWQQEFQLD